MNRFRWRLSVLRSNWRNRLRYLLAAPRVYRNWWAWPLPPAGPIEFVCEWPVFGVPETRATLDAQLILDAAGRSTQLWPEDGD